MLVAPTTAEDQSSTVRIDHEPKTIAEFSQIVRDAAVKGAVRVRFPSGEWNWYCTCQVELPKKERFSEWSSIGGQLKQDELEKWLTASKIAAVQISMSTDCAPSAFFEIEAFLRKRKIVYWVQSPDAATNPKKGIRLLETDGIERSIPESEGRPANRVERLMPRPLPIPPKDQPIPKNLNAQQAAP